MMCRTLSAGIAFCGLAVLGSEQAYASVGPGRGPGTRSVVTETSAKRSVSRADSKLVAQPKVRPSHRRGKPPKGPLARLPAGAPRAPQDTSARRQVAGGVLAEARVRPSADPQLAALHAAEQVLFPRALRGFHPGWSWSEADPSVQAEGLPPVIEAQPSATLAHATDVEWLRSLAMPDIPIRLDQRVIDYLKFYRDTKRGRNIATIWARKTGRYRSTIAVELAKAGLPKDLVWLSLIESGHDPTIVSPAGAAGLWQFMPATARMYGLTVDRWVDERLDPVQSTRAAAQFLRDLYQRLGVWELAFAAYNMGHGGLLRAVRKYNTNDFWQLSRLEAGLPWETTLYVPKIFAIAIVMNNRRAFGLAKVQPDPSITFDTISVSAGVPLANVAKATGIPLESLRSMNPQYKSNRTPPSGKGEAKNQKWPVRVPRGLGRKAASALAKVAHRQKYASYRVRFGDTLSGVALRQRTTEQELRRINVFRPRARLVPGMVLLVPRLAKGQRRVRDSEEAVVVPEERFHYSGRRRVFYRVLRSDTLTGVAHALRVTPKELAVWNSLDQRAKLQAGMILQAFVPKGVKLKNVRHVTADETRMFESGSKRFVEFFESKNGRRRLVVRAKRGDSLRKIGKRYGLSVGMMERINRVSRGKSLRPGDLVVVYAKRRAKSASVHKPFAAVKAPHPSVLPPNE